MFIEFFYLLRAKGLSISLDEWLCLIKALDKGLAMNSLMEFYYLCRNILVKTESDYDKFDMAFAEYFQGIQTVDEIPEELWNWLSADELGRELDDMPAWAREYDFDELMEMFRQRLAEQDEKHDGGNYWIGTGGTSAMGHGGYNPAGIRVGGHGRHQSAVKVAGRAQLQRFPPGYSFGYPPVSDGIPQAASVFDTGGNREERSWISRQPSTPPATMRGC